MQCNFSYPHSFSPFNSQLSKNSPNHPPLPLFTVSKSSLLPKNIVSSSCYAYFYSNRLSISLFILFSTFSKFPQSYSQLVISPSLIPWIFVREEWSSHAIKLNRCPNGVSGLLLTDRGLDCDTGCLPRMATLYWLSLSFNIIWR